MNKQIIQAATIAMFGVLLLAPVVGVGYLIVRAVKS